MGGGFIPGTLVETDTAPRAIESIAVGDYELSIDPRSEQCTYFYFVRLPFNLMLRAWQLAFDRQIPWLGAVLDACR